MNKTSSILICTTILALGYVLGYGSAPKEEIIITQVQEKQPLNEWELMQLAIIQTESSFDSLAVGKRGDWGIIQITPIYVKEVNRILGEERFIHEDAFNPQKSLEMFSIMQSYYNPLNDIDLAIANHNPRATLAYSNRVKSNMEQIRVYESYRKLIQE